MTTVMLVMINPYIDAMNVDLKAFRDETYRRIIGSRLLPVLDNLKEIKKMGIWFEVTSLLISGVNDDQHEIRDMAKQVNLEAGLSYVYLGNVKSDGDMDTKCPQCGYVLINRSYFEMTKNNIQDNYCPNCGMKVPGVGI